MLLALAAVDGLTARGLRPSSVRVGEVELVGLVDARPSAPAAVPERAASDLVREFGGDLMRKAEAAAAGGPVVHQEGEGEGEPPDPDE